MTYRGERFLELRNQLEQHTFHEVSQHRRDINNTLWILRRNFDLLREFTEDVAEDKESVLTGELSENLRVEKELYRLTHNYLASYYTLYGLTVTFRDSKFNEKSVNSYYDLMDKHDIRPTSDFLLKFRNYMQHQGVVEQNRQYRWNRDDDDEITQVVLFTEDLLEIDGWNQQAERYIRNQGERIRLVNVIENHHPDIVNFHDEIWDVVMSQYEEEFKDYQQKQDEMNEIVEEEIGNSN